MVESLLMAAVDVDTFRLLMLCCLGTMQYQLPPSSSDLYAGTSASSTVDGAQGGALLHVRHGSYRCVDLSKPSGSVRVIHCRPNCPP